MDCYFLSLSTVNIGQLSSHASSSITKVFLSVLALNGDRYNYNWDKKSRHVDVYVTKWGAFIGSTAVWAVRILTLNCYTMDTTGNMTSFQVTEASPTGQSSLHLPQGVMPPPPTYSPVFHASCLAILFAWMLVVISFSTDKCFGLASVSQRRLEKNKMGREGEATSATICGTSFHGLVINMLCWSTAML